MNTNSSTTLYKSISKAIFLAAGVFILLWFLMKVLSAILLLIFAIVLVLIINRPVALLEKRKIKRGWATFIVFGTMLLAIALLIWFIGPKINEQITDLIENLPKYAEDLSRTVRGWFSDYPDIQKEIKSETKNPEEWISVPETLKHIGNFSLSLVGGIIMGIIFLSMVVYAVANPKPLVELYLSIFTPEKRGKAATALANASVMLSGWIRADLIGGVIEGVLITIFLSIMNVPGAFVWGALAVFAELIPKIGFYLMSIPPILVALSINPTTAIWVTLFFLIMSEVMGSLVMPKLRSSTMNIHPFSTLFLLIAMGAAFGLMGALLATPLAAIIKAYYEEFYLKKFAEDEEMEKNIDTVLYQK